MRCSTRPRGDVTVLNANGSSTETVTLTSANGTLEGENGHDDERERALDHEPSRIRPARSVVAITVFDRTAATLRL